MPGSTSPPRRRGGLWGVACAAMALGIGAPLASAATQTHVLAGPSADLDIPGNRVAVATAPDGTAAAVHRQKVGVVERVFVSRRVGGVWQPGVRVDEGVPGPAGIPAIAVANGGRVAVAFASGPTNQERLHAAISSGPGQPFVHQMVQGDPGWQEGAIALGAAGDGYLVFHKGGGIWAFRLLDTTFTPVGAGFPDPAGNLISAPGNQAEPGSQRGARLAVNGDGTAATVAWSEDTGGGFRTFARRLTGSTPADLGAAIPYDLPSLQGQPAAGNFADMPDVAVAADGTAWVSMRQSFTYGAQNYFRGIVRPFDGTTAGPEQIIDGLGAQPAESTEFPRLAINSSGVGLAGSYRQLTFGTELSRLAAGTWSAATAVNTVPNEATGETTVALSDLGGGVVAHALTPSPTGDRTVSGRTVGLDGQLGAVEQLSNPSYGAVVGTLHSAAAAGTAHTGFVQGQGALTRLVVADTDLPVPPTPTPPTPPGPGAPTGPQQPPAPPRGAGPPTGPNTPSALQVRQLSIHPRAVVRGTRPLLRVAGRTPPQRIRVVVNRPGLVRLSAQRRLEGRRAGSRCVAVAAGNRRARPCVRWVSTGGTVSVRLTAGTNLLRFEGRLGGRRALAVGTYRLLARAADRSGAVRHTTFRVVARRGR